MCDLERPTLPSPPPNSFPRPPEQRRRSAFARSPSNLSPQAPMTDANPSTQSIRPAFTHSSSLLSLQAPALAVMEDTRMRLAQKLNDVAARLQSQKAVE
jgi:hypothetical protein